MQSGGKSLDALFLTGGHARQASAASGREALFRFFRGRRSALWPPNAAKRLARQENPIGW
jgi:hypothetical protein